MPMARGAGQPLHDGGVSADRAPAVWPSAASLCPASPTPLPHLPLGRGVCREVVLQQLPQAALQTAHEEADYVANLVWRTGLWSWFCLAKGGLKTGSLLCGAVLN
jgi:hypothetical protein